jgi:glucosaminylphosphatidylinositol acyltransferase
LLVLPLLLAQTVFAEVPGWFSLGLLVPTGLILCLPVREVGTPLPAGDTRSWENSAVKEKAERTGMSAATSTERTVPAGEAISPLPALTVYRSHMMLMTVLAILAVDFPIFPRMLAKCETYGVSLVRAIIPLSYTYIRF